MGNHIKNLRNLTMTCYESKLIIPSFTNNFSHDLKSDSSQTFSHKVALKESRTLILISMKSCRCKSVSLAYKLTFFAENNVVYLNKRVTHENAKKA